MGARRWLGQRHVRFYVSAVAVLVVGRYQGRMWGGEGMKVVGCRFSLPHLIVFHGGVPLVECVRSGVMQCGG